MSIPDEIEAPPPSRPESAEPRELEARVLTLWWITASARAVLFSTAIFMAFLLFVPNINALSWLLPVGPGPFVVAVVVWAIIVPPLRFRRWRYALRPDDLWIRQGLLWRSVSVIPYRRLQFVDTRQGPLENLFDLAQLVVHTAAPGTSGLVPGLDRAEAETIRERLAALAGETDDPV
ncbi:MAG: hypothetical protein EA351_09305 [Gemmatimonadales bacterium]|nr:MAG: hypothetical protein EA351_09305 [Gemmatimonadales bacterium]